jgi:stress response protein YsnF
LVSEVLASENVSIERVPIGKPLEGNRVPEVRPLGDTLVIPLVEEVLTIERRLILKEEIRIRRTQSSHTHQERVNVRKQEVVITHKPPITKEK